MGKEQNHKIKAWIEGQHTSLDAEHKSILAANKGAVWIHAASVGEFEQARPLIEKLRKQQPHKRIVLSFFSPSGYELRKGYDQVDAVVYLPLATRMNANQFLDALEPEMAIFVKYEFWPAYLRALKRRGIKTYSISAIFRPSQRFFHWYGRSSLALLKCFTHIYVQDEGSYELLKKHGIEACSITGDTRFDRVLEVMERGVAQAGDRLTPIAQFVDGAERVLVAGSTWPKDEALLARYIEEANENGRPTKLILVPHEIDKEHIQYIFNLMQGRMVKYSTISAMESNMSRLNILHHARVLVIDTMGLLSTIYRFGHVAYIGGGFGVGIHNTIEAAVYGMPVIWGPNYHHFREAQGLIDAKAGRSIASYEELAESVEQAFEQKEAISQRAKAYIASELGATERIFGEIFLI